MRRSYRSWLDRGHGVLYPVAPMAAQYSIYVIGYSPPELAMERVSRADISRMIGEADCAVQHEAGIPVGTVLDTYTLVPGSNGRCPRDGTTLRAVAHKYFGKIVVFEEVT